MRPLAVLALLAPLVLVATAGADSVPDAGVALDGGIVPGAANVDGGAAQDGATPGDAEMIAPAPAPSVGTPAAPSPYALLSPTPQGNDAPPRARPTPLYRSPLFWTSVILGAVAIAAVATGVGLAATYHSRYALLSF